MRVMLFLDRMQYLEDGKLDRVVDVLTHKGAMHPTVLVFINPGRPSEAPKDYNQYTAYFESPRNFEYDYVGPRFAQFLEQDVLPLVEPKVGRSVSKDPEDTCIVGISSGGIAALCAAWHRPGLIRKVIAIVPSFTHLARNTEYAEESSTSKHGYEFPYMVRGEDKKHLRVWLQSGTGDMNNDAGHWASAFMVMVKALEFREYDFKYVFEEGLGHSNDYFFHHAPEILRWVLK